MVRVQLDLCGLVPAQHHHLATALARTVAVPAEQMVITYSHTHSAGWQAPDRFDLPGGEFIAPYLLNLERRHAKARHGHWRRCMK